MVNYLPVTVRGVADTGVVAGICEAEACVDGAAADDNSTFSADVCGGGGVALDDGRLGSGGGGGKSGCWFAFLDLRDCTMSRSSSDESPYRTTGL